MARTDRPKRGHHTSERIVRDLLSASIRHGSISVTDSLTEHELVPKLRASRGAIRSALRALAEEGLVLRRQRLGTFAKGRTVRVKWDGMAPEPEASRLEARFLLEDTVPTTPLLAQWLRVDDPHLHLIDILLLSDGAPIGLRTLYVRNRTFRTWQNRRPGPAMVPGEVIAALAHWSVARMEIGGTRADPQTARLLRVEADTPMVTRWQVYVDREGIPAASAFDQYRSDVVSILWQLAEEADSVEEAPNHR